LQLLRRSKLIGDHRENAHLIRQKMHLLVLRARL
jgi:hypothetical protein